MNAEFFSAIADIEKEKGIPQSYMLEKIEQALLAALKKDSPSSQESARVVLDPEKKTVHMFLQKTVAEPVTDPGTQLSLEQARRINPTAEAGDVINETVDAKKFGRIAAQAAKQVIIQGIREAERGIVYDEFTSKEHEILTGVVTRIEPRNGSVSIRSARTPNTRKPCCRPESAFRMKSCARVTGSRYMWWRSGNRPADRRF
jgi:N utilization substance protein A